jgi:hypothetical protein
LRRFSWIALADVELVLGGSRPFEMIDGEYNRKDKQEADEPISLCRCHGVSLSKPISQWRGRAGEVWTEAEVKMREYLAKAIEEERENTEPSARLTEPSATNPICEKTYFGS